MMIKLNTGYVASNEVPADAMADSYKVGMSALHNLNVFGYYLRFF